MEIKIGDTVEIAPENPTFTRRLDDNGEWQFVELQRPPRTGTVTGIRDTTLENESFREYCIDGKWYHSRYIKHVDKESMVKQTEESINVHTLDATLQKTSIKVS